MDMGRQFSSNFWWLFAEGLPFGAVSATDDRDDFHGHGAPVPKGKCERQCVFDGRGLSAEEDPHSGGQRQDLREALAGIRRETSEGLPGQGWERQTVPACACTALWAVLAAPVHMIDGRLR